MMPPSDNQPQRPTSSPLPALEDSHPDLDAWSAAASSRRHRRGRRRIFGRLRLLTFTALGIVLVASSVTLARTSGPEPITHRAVAPKTATAASSTPAKFERTTPRQTVTKISRETQVAAEPVVAAEAASPVAPAPQATELPRTGDDGALAAMRLGAMLIMFGMLLHGATAPVRRQRSPAMNPH